MLTLTARTSSVPKELPPKNERSRPCAWTAPSLIEISIGLEINGYLPAEF